MSQASISSAAQPKEGILLTEHKPKDPSLEVFVDPKVFGFLLDRPETEQAYHSLVENLRTLFAFVETIQEKFRETMETKDVQYMVAFKEHMSTTHMQIESLRKEITSKNKKDMASKAIELLSKDVKKYKEHCDILFKEREKLAQENKDLREKINILELDNHNLKTLLMTSKIEAKLLKDDLNDIKSEEYQQLGLSNLLKERTGPVFRVNHSTSIEYGSSRSRDINSLRESHGTGSALQKLKPELTEHRSRSEYSKNSRTSRGQVELPKVEQLRRIVQGGANPTKNNTGTSKRMMLKERVNTTGIRLGRNEITGGMNMSMNMPE